MGQGEGMRQAGLLSSPARHQTAPVTVCLSGTTHLSDPQFFQLQNILGLSEVKVLRLLAWVLVSSQWEPLSTTQGL